MKKLLLSIILCLFTIQANAQEIFGSATNKSLDGYVTVGYIKNGWGVYAGAPYNDINLLNPQKGTITSQAKYGIIRMLSNDKMMVGAGLQPTTSGNKLNVFLGYAPLKSTDMKLWVIGNLVGDQFAAGLGLSYKLGK